MATVDERVRFLPTPRNVTLQIRVTTDEALALEQIAESMLKDHSDVRKVDGGINVSAVVRHLIAEGLDRRQGAKRR